MARRLRRGIGAALAVSSFCVGDIVLIGSDIPNRSVLDGDFEAYQANWRRPEPSPHWITQTTQGGHIGFAEGRLMLNWAGHGTAESVVLNHTGIKVLKAGDVLAWRFASNTEYSCDGRVTLALVFGDQERIVAGRVKVPNGPAKPQVYEGYYTVTAEDAELGMPRIRFTLESTHNIIVYVNWVDLKVLRGDRIAELAANAVDTGIELTWTQVGLDRRAGSGGRPGGPSLPVEIYRSENERKGFEKAAEGVTGNRWTDKTTISGKTYYYAVKRGTSASPVVKVRKVDSIAPAAPDNLTAAGTDWTAKLSWDIPDKDIAYYQIYRGDAGGKNMVCIAPHVGRNSFEDQLPIKGMDNAYAVRAVDYSGNEGPLSETASARARAVRGASFSDLILPMPIFEQLRSDVWGADAVKPRDPANGIEHCAWSYWGGKAVHDPAGGEYHMNVVRWPESHRKGHWAWPESTVAYVVSDCPSGPYKVVRELAYDYKNGRGHNANLIRLNDGTYALYSLINWKAVILTSDTMSGPWKVLGEMKVNVPEGYINAYRLERNLSGVQCEDGSFLFVTKAGAMIRSTEGILGPYDVVSGVIGENKSIPEQYRRSNYEDPTLWYDGVQYHMLINAFLDYRAIYLRSPDGIHWKYEQGLAYTPSCTLYEDGTRTFWYKVERPNVIQDEFGRATHLQLAAVDVPKADDYGNDNHSSKHLIVPLVVNRRLTLLNRDPVTAGTKEINVLIHSETGFDAANDLVLESLRFGGSESVNFGGGAVLHKTMQHGDGLVLVFRGDNGIADQNFVGKLIGRTKDGGLVVGYAPLVAE